jgi:hypothetical protein
VPVLFHTDRQECLSYWTDELFMSMHYCPVKPLLVSCKFLLGFIL